MSKHETPLTRRFWQEVGGTLVEEFLAVPKSETNGSRLIDGVIIPDASPGIKSKKEVDLEGKDIIVVQTKAKRLGMYLLGQAVFSSLLLERYKPASVKSVVICTKSDSVLEPLAEEFGIEVVVYSK